MDDTANAQLVRSIMAAISARDMGPVRTSYAPTATVRFPDRTVTGPDEIIAYFDGLFAALPDVELKPLYTATEGDTVFVRWHMTGTHTGAAWSGIEPTGASIELDGIDHFTIRDGSRRVGVRRLRPDDGRPRDGPAPARRVGRATRR